MESLRELFKIGFGPSSSHTMGPQRAASKIKEKYPQATHYEVDLYGSLALTGKGHLTDYIIKKTLGEETLVHFKSDSLPYHPNGMKFYVYQDEQLLDTITAYSIGGGTVEFKGCQLQQTKQVYPHKNLKEIIQYIEDNGISFYDYVLNYEDEYFKAYLEEGHNLDRATTIKNLWKCIEKRAFESADILVFPSIESMEPLSLTMDGFSELSKKKDIRFLPSGAKALKSVLTKEQAKKKYGVEGKFVIGYVGRHNEIKGYDILKSAAERVLKKDKNICFLIGGSQGKTFNALNDVNWIEAGWVNPADLFMALDAFVLPNRMTYFDLVLLEVMSMGIPIIASNTGGNKSVQNATNALALYNDIDDLVHTILNFKSKDAGELECISQNVYSAYMENYTPEIFATNYLNLINQIYDDYKFFKKGECL